MACKRSVGSSPIASTLEMTAVALLEILNQVGFTLGGVVAGEDCFFVTRKLPSFASGEARLRFVFTMTMADRDRRLLEALQGFLGQGSICDKPPAQEGWQPTSTLQVSSLTAHRAATIPFFDRFLLPCAKRSQYEAWKEAMFAYEKEHPSRYGKGPSPCGAEGCDRPVRGRRALPFPLLPCHRLLTRVPSPAASSPRRARS